MSIEFEIVKVTPALATQWLNESNVHNRPLKNAHVERYASDMKGGFWKLNHQGIAFTKVDGRSGKRTLIDGQHRLWAVIESKMSVEIMVFTGFTLDSQDSVDQGVPRSVLDVIKLADPDAELSKFEVSIARRTMSGVRQKVLYTRAAVVDFIQQHQKALNFVTADAFQGRRISRVMPAGVGAVLARAYYTEDHNRLLRFGALIVGATPEGAAESGPHLLRNWLLAGSPIHGKESRESLVYQKSQRALLSFLQLQPISRNLLPIREEQWPLPGEAPRRAKSRMRKA